MSNDTYSLLAQGDAQTLAALGISPRIAALAAEARKRRALAPSPAARAPQAPPAPAAARRPSRAAEIAAVHLRGVNESRKRCGLPPVDAATLATEFDDIDQLPPPRTKLTRREAGNAMAQRLGGAPADQTSIDAMWSGIAAQLNATPASPPDSASRAPQSQASIDDMWGSLATDLNKKAGLATPVMDRAR
jgi:hypothetical protein